MDHTNLIESNDLIDEEVEISANDQPDSSTNHQSTSNNNDQRSMFEGCDEEEFLIHLQFDEDSHPLLRYDVNDFKILGIHNGRLFIRIGDSFFFGQLDQRQQSSILFAYEPVHKFIQEIHKSFQKILMKRVILKEKCDNIDDNR